MLYSRRKRSIISNKDVMRLLSIHGVISLIREWRMRNEGTEIEQRA